LEELGYYNKLIDDVVSIAVNISTSPDEKEEPEKIQARMA